MNGRRKVYYLYLESIIKSRPAITLLYFQTAYIKKKQELNGVYIGDVFERVNKM